MKRELIVQLHADFEGLVQQHPNSGVEFWMARDLQEVLDYARWENFSKVIEKARSACQNAGYDMGDHFLDVTKMVDIGSGAQRPVEDIALSRYACYLIAQNGDPAKPAALYFSRLQNEKQVALQEIAKFTLNTSASPDARLLRGLPQLYAVAASQDQDVAGMLYNALRKLPKTRSAKVLFHRDSIAKLTQWAVAEEQAYSI